MILKNSKVAKERIKVKLALTFSTDSPIVVLVNEIIVSIKILFIQSKIVTYLFNFLLILFVD